MKKNYATGLILLDKDTGMSSNHALQKVKHHFHFNKIGHTGTLDPLATGLLPLCIGEAPKFSGHLLNSDKEYIAEIKLGLVTDTQDITGTIIANNAVTENFNLQQIEDVLSKFLGGSQQIPPIYSALKHEGQPLYKYARTGNTNIVKPARTIKIYKIELLHYDYAQQTITIKTLVSKGTYIRVLADNISKKLCGYGGSLNNLRRTKTGFFDIKNAVTLKTIYKSQDLSNILLPVNILLTDTTRYNLDDIEFKKITRGVAIFYDHKQINIDCISTEISLFFNDIFIGIACCQDNTLQAKRLVSDDFLSRNNFINI